jgi:transforming growth factor-beta-induced protein
VINADILLANGVLHVIDEVLNPSSPDAEPSDNTADEAVSLPPVVPFTSGIEPETSVYSELTQTTSFVAAGLVTAAPNATTSAGAGTSTTGAPVVEQTANAGVRREMPVLAAVAVGAVAFAVQM